MSQLSEQDPAGGKRLYREFVKQREIADKYKQKLNFSMHVYIEAEKASSGTRAERVGEMMWEG
eukprot:1576300-Lingulodinium_polyedra.AAC.1